MKQIIVMVDSINDKAPWSLSKAESNWTEVLSPRSTANTTSIYEVGTHKLVDGYAQPLPKNQIGKVFCKSLMRDIFSDGEIEVEVMVKNSRKSLFKTECPYQAFQWLTLNTDLPTLMSNLACKSGEEIFKALKVDEVEAIQKGEHK